MKKENIFLERLVLQNKKIYIQNNSMKNQKKITII